MAVVEEVRPALPDVVHGRAVVAMVGIDAVHTGEESPMDCDDDDGMWDPRNDFETVDGMPVYYGGDFSDSDCEDPGDVAYEDWLDWYNFNAPGDDRLPIALGSAVIMVGAAAQPAYVQRALLATSVPMLDIEITVPVGNIPMTGNDTPIAAESADPRTVCATRKRIPVYYEEDLNDSDYETPGDNDYATAYPRNNFETVNGMPVYYGGDLNDSSPRGIMIMIPGRTGVILTFGTGIAGFSQTMRKPSCRSYLVPRCFGGKAWVSRYECDRTVGVHLDRWCMPTPIQS